MTHRRLSGRRRASLTFVGLGIRVPAHVTSEARECIESADEVLHLVTDPRAVSWIKSIKPRARSLYRLYEPGKPRTETYAATVDEILSAVRRGQHVCVAFYGHPGVFVASSREAIRIARSEGFEARMLPGISAEACLFADLDIDPCTSGWQSYEATDLLTREREISTSAALILWQPSIVGRPDFVAKGDLENIPVLIEYLQRFYPPDHEVICYEASESARRSARIDSVPLSKLAHAKISPATTLFIPPAQRRAQDPQVLERLGYETAVAAART